MHGEQGFRLGDYQPEFVLINHAKYHGGQKIRWVIFSKAVVQKLGGSLKQEL